MLKVAICGASGYTGAELLRLLQGHPDVQVVALTSQRHQGKSPLELYPHLQAYGHLRYEPLQPERLLRKADFFFLALPHRTAQPAVEYFFKAGKMAVDLSADFRLRDPLVYEQWYQVPHHHRDVLRKAVYGLAELHRARIRRATLVANPGCYPTAALLALYPALKAGLIEPGGIVVDAKSGTTGAGRQSNESFSFSEVNEDFRPYSVACHRHTPEMEQEVARIAKRPVRLSFVPHLLALDRGILCSIYAPLRKGTSTAQVLALYRRTYAKEPFVKVLPEGQMPRLKAVRGTNFCHIAAVVDERARRLVLLSALDNLVKGASGQAVQNMNLMAGLPETQGLLGPALMP